MVAAFAIWNGRIAPVFDVTRNLHLVERQGSRLVKETQVQLHGETPSQISLSLMELNVRALICGAISQPLQAMVTACGIEVIPFVAGELGEVIDAWMQGVLMRRRTFAMPGCDRGNRRHGCRMNSHRAEVEMFGRVGGRGAGSGGGQGVGNRGGGGRGRMGGLKSGGPSGECLCPACGHHETHQRGVPCTQMRCPKCGTTMVRN